MKYRLDKQGLLGELSVWDGYLKKEIDLKLLVERFRETASFDISEKRINKNLDYFLNRLRKEA